MSDEVIAIIIIGSVLLMYIIMRIMSGSSSKEELFYLNTNITKEGALKLLSGRFKIFATLFALAFLLSLFHLGSFLPGETMVITFLVNVILLVASIVSYVRYTKMRKRVEPLYYGGHYKSLTGFMSKVMFGVTIIFLVIAALPVIFYIFMVVTGQSFLA